MKVRLLLGNAEIAEVRTSPNLSGFPTNRELTGLRPTMALEVGTGPNFSGKAKQARGLFQSYTSSARAVLGLKNRTRVKPKSRRRGVSWRFSCATRHRLRAVAIRDE